MQDIRFLAWVEENAISYSCADLPPPTTTTYLGPLSELVLARMLSKFGAKSLEWTTRPWNPAASAADGDKALGTLGELQPCTHAYFKSRSNIFKLSTDAGAQNNPGVFEDCYGPLVLVLDVHVPGTIRRPPYVDDLDFEFDFVFQKSFRKSFHIMTHILSG